MIARRIRAGLLAYGLSPAPAEVLSRYCDALLEQNQVMNLTAITDPEQVADLHMLDSAALLTVADLAGKSVIDVGTGGGFPGLVLKLVEPSIRLTLLDSLGKRVNWLAEIAPKLGAADVTCIHGRGEEQSLLPAFRDQYDVAVSRAVADLRLLTELCLPFVKVGGTFFAMKSGDCQAEVDRAGRAVSVLGGRLKPVSRYQIPGPEVFRQVVAVEKVAPTPKGYPRRFARMKKNPL